MNKPEKQNQPCCTLNIEGEQQKNLVQIFKALGNPVRFEIMKFLLTHPGCITGDIVAAMPIAQATTSQHLKVLKESGLIDGEIEGASTCYCLNKVALTWFKSKVGEIF